MLLLNSPNYSGRQNNSTSYIKNYIGGLPPDLWSLVSYKNDNRSANTLTPNSRSYDNVLIN